MAGEVTWFEFGTADPAALDEFYGQLFGWTTDGGDNPMSYRTITAGTKEQKAGIDGGMWPTPEGSAPYLVPYVRVDDMDVALARALDLGATQALPVGRNPDLLFAHITDPQGHRIGLLQYLS